MIFRHVWVRGGGAPQKKLFTGEGGEVRDFEGDFQSTLMDASQDFDLVLVIFSGFQPTDPMKPWNWAIPVT